ncbi:hypothetical protein [Staphylococcus warneri]|uniref:hypothetical protein n=1 Tax=Staphylococcus warneri TaxID=1292 RepID=UPI0011A335C7|nr:hypothetical protein [Staphylococcus warneri]
MYGGSVGNSSGDKGSEGKSGVENGWEGGSGKDVKGSGKRYCNNRGNRKDGSESGRSEIRVVV